MEKNLLAKVNKIQEQSSRLGYDPIQLPQIVVVGTQSAGKSSVLESLVKKSFLPRGKGIVTRCPLVLQLNRCPFGDPRRKRIDHEEWGTFAHSGDQIFQMEEISQEIEAETSRRAGTNKGIVAAAIILRVYSPHVVDLTLVDLPGITKVPVGDQPHDIEQQIQRLIFEYIENPLTIILAVVTANTDMATNESLKLAKRVDPEGLRTLAVVTKIDLMDEGTDARDILRGTLIPVKLGIIGVINRSQKALDDNKSMEDALKYEEDFFRKNYKEMASRSGSPYLSKTLSKLLSAHINKTLPDVENKIRLEMSECAKILRDCGERITDTRAALMNVVNQFCQDFCSLKGPQNLKSIKLTGGAKLCDILHSRLEKIFAKSEPCKSYTVDQVIIALRQSNGLKPPFFVSEEAFEMLVKPLIERMEQPALACVDAVKKELGNMCQTSIPPQLELRFPVLTQALSRVVLALIEQKASRAIQMIKDMVQIEAGHITYYRIDVLKEEFQEILTDDGNDRNDEIPFRQGTMQADLLNKASRLSGRAKAEIAEQLTLLEMSEKDKKHVIILGKMLDHYYKIVADTMQDSTAKAVVTFLVNEVRGSLNAELCMALIQMDLAELFTEKDNIVDKREATQEKLEVLEKALEVLTGISAY